MRKIKKQFDKTGVNDSDLHQSNRIMSDQDDKPNWYTIRAAAKYLEVGEPTIYRWMRDGRITFRKVGDSTRFLKEDLDAVVQVHPSAKEVHKVQMICPVCHHDEMIEGALEATGRNYFRPGNVKFWTLKDINIKTQARMCARCGYVGVFGDLEKLESLKADMKRAAEEEAKGEDGD